MKKITLNNVKIKYMYGATAINSISLEMHCGDKIAVVGDKNSGKSSLLKTLAGLLQPLEGSIDLDGIDFCKLNIKDKNVIFVQDLENIFNLRSVNFNLAYPLKIRKVKKDIRKNIVGDAVKIWDLENELHKFAFRLSEYKKVCLAYARLSIRNAQLVLIDDLYSILPKQLQRFIFDNISNKIATNENIVVLATKNIEDALCFTNNLICLKEGAVVGIGTYEDLKSKAPTLACLQMLNKNFISFTTKIEINCEKAKVKIDDKNTIEFDKSLLIDESFLGKQVIVAVNDNFEVFLFDELSENNICNNNVSIATNYKLTSK